MTLLLPDFVLGQAGVENKGLVSTTCVSGWDWKPSDPPTDAGGTDFLALLICPQHKIR
ncbi:MAG: hypothetical protein HY774_12195 [Acidobacteria bacterium]|nr:hypothetical protein [Acidobacteriota bacterium]